MSLSENGNKALRDAMDVLYAKTNLMPSTNTDLIVVRQLQKLFQAGQADEREECAKVCSDNYGCDCAAAIRRRSEGAT